MAGMEVGVEQQRAQRGASGKQQAQRRETQRQLAQVESLKSAMGTPKSPKDDTSSNDDGNMAPMVEQGASNAEAISTLRRRMNGMGSPSNSEGRKSTKTLQEFRGENSRMKTESEEATMRSGFSGHNDYVPSPAAATRDV